MSSSGSRECKSSNRLSGPGGLRWGWLLVLFALSGCATYADRLREVRHQFYQGHLDAAKDLTQKGGKHRSDRDVCELDRAVIQLAEGHPDQAEQTLRVVRDRFDTLEGPRAGQQVVSMLSDANHTTYPGEDYEKVLVRTYLALANLLGDGGDAGAYALQITDKQQQIIQAALDPQGQNPKASYQQVAIGPYLRSAVREETHANYDDVERACTLVCNWQPDFPYANQDLDRARHGTHSAPGCGVLYVFTMVGEGPHKEEVIEAPSSISLLIADQILSATGKHTLPPTIAPIKVPKVVPSFHNVGAVGLMVDGRPVGKTATITDIGRMAVQQHEAVYDRIVAEAVVRRVVKKGVIYGVKEATGTKNQSMSNVALDLVGVAWEATESADTRCWGLLPDKIQVLRIELPAGTHSISLQSLNAGGYPSGSLYPATVNVSNGRNTYVLANFPSSTLVGSILTSTPH